MRTSTFRKRVVIAGLVASLFLILPGLVWLSLTHKPNFYRDLTNLPREQLQGKAKHFVASSLQLRNDITNEPDWQAVFTDQEVNAWLAEDLVTHFADQIPPEVHEPRVAFSGDRVTLAFQLDKGPIRTVIWVVIQASVPEDNVLALTIEKIRAGVIPISADRFIEPISFQAKEHGLDLQWSRENDMPVARIRFNPSHDRTDIVLEQLNIRKGQIRLSGRSDRLQGTAVKPQLPTRRILQLNFPQRNSQRRTSSINRQRNSTTPST
jgi:hypothetical protein